MQHIDGSSKKWLSRNPLYWSLLDNKSGNSHCKDRIDLLSKLIKVIGKERIGVIVGDREFIGVEWVKYLKINDIKFCMRVPKSHLVTLKNGDCYSIETLLHTQTERYFQDCRVDGIWCNTMIKRLLNNDFLFLIVFFIKSNSPGSGKSPLVSKNLE